MNFFYKSTQKIGINVNKFSNFAFQNRFSMNLLKIIMLVVVSPRIGWDEVNRSSVKTSDILSKAFFPMLIFLALTAFAPLIYDANLTFVSAIISSIFHFSAYFLSYYLVSYLLGGFYPELVKTKAGKGRVNDFILFNI